MKQELIKQIKKLTPVGSPAYNTGFKHAQIAALCMVDLCGETVPKDQLDAAKTLIDDLTKRIEHLSSIINKRWVEDHKAKDHRTDAFMYAIHGAREMPDAGCASNKIKLVDDFDIKLRKGELVTAMTIHNGRLVIGTDEGRVMFFELGE